ncbi:uncharacterized protein KY384_005546 [Bacidia gigantensis]|uniref:uncharacterized protein n=1 Tax=Bacidia gigantensis TaxID=2732470 RepID=UPI001D0423B2|nr:uncharacterized protein KY384_005546 [Bacidia gigantensis]KAG8530064.1 hypothetical protein KY384_005546 [Bacidia gigantensis]
MAAVDVGVRNAPPINDDLDNLFNYEVDNELLRDVDTNMDVTPKGQAKAKQQNSSGGILGLDEEIKVTKKRAPIAKLDEARLLSQAGIPKLRRTARERLRFKGKGHEFSDCARLLNFYQLWLDDLYPRAKFADGLAIIEKLGHKKRIQTMRREWINESKIRLSSQKDGQDRSQESVRRANVSLEVTRSSQEPQEKESADTGGTSGTVPANSEPEKSLMWDSGEQADDGLFLSEDEENREPPLDDLDALFAEDEARHAASGPGVKEGQAVIANDFADEEDAMAAMNAVW